MSQRSGSGFVSFILIGAAAVTMIYWVRVLKKMAVDQKPKYTANKCELISQNYIDEILEVNGSSCLQINRTWILTDICKSDPNDPDAGVITYMVTQDEKTYYHAVFQLRKELTAINIWAEAEYVDENGVQRGLDKTTFDEFVRSVSIK